MPSEEARRLATLHGLRLVETGLSDEIRGVLEAVERLLPAPFVALALVDEDTVHVKTAQPVAVDRAPRASCFATLVLQEGRTVHVPDVARDPRVRAAPAHKLLGLRHLLGMPVRARNGRPVGALVAGGPAARHFSEPTIAAFESLGRVVEDLLRLQVLDQVLASDETEPANPDALARRLAQNWPQLEIALGLPRMEPEVREQSGRWAQYDPDLFRLVLRRGASEILARLQESAPRRFKDLLQEIPDMNQRTLTTRLRELEEHGLLTRTVFREIPPRVEYAIAPDAEKLVSQILQLLNASRGG